MLIGQEVFFVLKPENPLYFGQKYVMIVFAGMERVTHRRSPSESRDMGWERGGGRAGEVHSGAFALKDQ